MIIENIVKNKRKCMSPWAYHYITKREKQTRIQKYPIDQGISKCITKDRPIVTDSDIAGIRFNIVMLRSPTVMSCLIRSMT